jgi:hypothetical protein
VGLVLIGLLAAPGLTAQGPASGPVASAESTVQDAGKTVTREVTDSWLTLKTKLALLGDERVSSNDVSVKTVKGVITLHGKVASAAEQQAVEEIALTIEGHKKVVNQLTVVPTAGGRWSIGRTTAVTDVKQGLRCVSEEDRHRGARGGIVTLTGKALVGPASAPPRRLAGGRRPRCAERAGYAGPGDPDARAGRAPSAVHGDHLAG